MFEPWAFNVKLFILCRTLASYKSTMPPVRAAGTLAVNGFSTYFSTRTNPVDIRAGQEVNIMLRPVSHRATERFRDLDKEKRKCSFPHEREVQGNYNP